MLKFLIYPMALSVALMSTLTAAISADITDADLARLAGSLAVKNTDLPFLKAPPPDESRFITMSDGVMLAVSLYFPRGFDPNVATAPAVFEDSIYGRREDASTTAIDLYRAAGFVVVIGDARGFGASFGSQAGFNTAQQTADEAEVIAWIASQPWSNGKVGAIGHSVSAVFADSMTSTGAPALKAAIIRASDFDEYSHNMFPGGVPNLGILALARQLMQWHAGGDCIEDLKACGELGFAPVDKDETFEQLQAAMRDHKGNIESGVFERLVYRDDALGSETIGSSGAIARIEGIRKAAVPARVTASWVDGVTALGALTRFEMARDVPMEVVIGATSHGGGLDADPYSLEPFTPADPSATEQFNSDVAFISRVMTGEPVGRSISYVVLGTDVWKTTDVWPPTNVPTQSFYLGQRQFTRDPPNRSNETFVVDLTSTSGKFNRWAAQRGTPIFYGNRNSASGRRLVFDGKPLLEDQELVGPVELCLTLSTDQRDGVIIGYLEDVAPDGRVTYLTEGMLRLLHRKTIGPQCEESPGARRSFSRADGAEVIPGEMMQIEIALLPVAARIARGHSLRLSLAGADAGWFDGLTGDHPATWIVSYGGEDASTIMIPMRPWSDR